MDWKEKDIEVIEWWDTDDTTRFVIFFSLSSCMLARFFLCFFRHSISCNLAVEFVDWNKKTIKNPDWLGFHRERVTQYINIPITMNFDEWIFLRSFENDLKSNEMIRWFFSLWMLFWMSRSKKSLPIITLFFSLYSWQTSKHRIDCSIRHDEMKRCMETDEKKN